MQHFFKENETMTSIMNVLNVKFPINFFFINTTGCDLLSDIISIYSLTQCIQKVLQHL